MDDVEVRGKGRYKIEQIGYIRRLVIERLTLSATVSVVSTIGTSKLESILNMKGKDDAEEFYMYSPKKK